MLIKNFPFSPVQKDFVSDVVSGKTPACKELGLGLYKRVYLVDGKAFKVCRDSSEDTLETILEEDAFFSGLPESKQYLFPKYDGFFFKGGKIFLIQEYVDGFMLPQKVFSDIQDTYIKPALKKVGLYGVLNDLHWENIIFTDAQDYSKFKIIDFLCETGLPDGILTEYSNKMNAVDEEIQL